MTTEVQRPSNVVPFRATLEKPQALRVVEKGDIVAIEIYDEIGGWGLSASYVIDALKEADGEGKTVQLRINSPGGDVFEGVAISTAIKRMKAKTVAVIDGLAASIASLIAISCDEIEMPSNAFMMIHKAWTVSFGNADELMAMAEVLSKIDEQLANAYLAKATALIGEDAANGIDFAQLMKDETWLTAQDAAAFGLCSAVMDEVQIAASIRPDVAAKFQNTPAELIVSEEETPEGDDAEAEAGPEEDAQEPEAEDPQDPAAAVVSEDGAEGDDEEPSETYKAEIRTLCSLAEKPELADDFIANRTSFEDVRAAIWDRKAEDDEASETDPTVEVQAGKPNPAARTMNQIRERQYARLNRKPSQ